MKPVELYFDFSCPWSYLALVRLEDVADRNATPIELRPVLVNEVLATENPPLARERFAENPAKARWQRRDLDDWAALWGLAIDLPDDWPCDPSLAAAGCVYAAAEGRGRAYALAVFRAYFSAGSNIEEPAVLADLAAATGLDKTAFLAAIQDTANLEQVKAWTAELVRSGGFGTPTMLIGERLFFGNDRLQLVEWQIGPMSQADFVAPGQHGGE